MHITIYKEKNNKKKLVGKIEILKTTNQGGRRPSFNGRYQQAKNQYQKGNDNKVSSPWIEALYRPKKLRVYIEELHDLRSPQEPVFRSR